MTLKVVNEPEDGVKLPIMIPLIVPPLKVTLLLLKVLNTPEAGVVLPIKVPLIVPPLITKLLPLIIWLPALKVPDKDVAAKKEEYKVEI